MTTDMDSLRHQLQAKIDHLNKPLGSLGRLEQIAMQIGLVQHTLEPELRHPVHLLFGGDHGIEREGVSLSPRCVTWQQMVNFTRGGGGVNMFCRQHGFELHVVDVGVDHDLSGVEGIVHRKVARGTANFLHQPALTPEQMEAAMTVGRDMASLAAAEGCNVLSIGEMGIANTSPSSIWMSVLLGLPLEQCVGAGAGLSSEGVSHKLRVLQQSIDRWQNTVQGVRHHHAGCEPSPCRETLVTMQGASPHTAAPARLATELMREFGGLEMVAAVGAMLRAEELGMVVLVDGFIMTACALVARSLHPSFMDCAIFGHCGDESGHRLMLRAMGAQPLLSLGLRLGEGTGALCAYPIVESAVRMLREMGNFTDNHITKYF